MARLVVARSDGRWPALDPVVGDRHERGARRWPRAHVARDAVAPLRCARLRGLGARVRVVTRFALGVPPRRRLIEGALVRVVAARASQLAGRLLPASALHHALRVREQDEAVSLGGIADEVDAVVRQPLTRPVAEFLPVAPQAGGVRLVALHTHVELPRRGQARRVDDVLRLERLRVSLARSVAPLAADARGDGVDELVVGPRSTLRVIGMARDAERAQGLGEARVALGRPGVDAPALRLRVVVDRDLVEAAALAEVERHAVAARAVGQGDGLHPRLQVRAILGDHELLDEVVGSLAEGAVPEAASLVQDRLGGPRVEDARQPPGVERRQRPRSRASHRVARVARVQSLVAVLARLGADVSRLGEATRRRRGDGA